MAGEIRTKAELQLVNGQINSKLSIEKRSDQTTPGIWQGVQNIGTSEEDLVTSGVAAPRVIAIQNLDDTNYVEYGPKSGGSMVGIGRLYPGEGDVIHLKPSVVLRLVANTAAVDVAYALAET